MMKSQTIEQLLNLSSQSCAILQQSNSTKSTMVKWFNGSMPQESTQVQKIQKHYRSKKKNTVKTVTHNFAPEGMSVAGCCPLINIQPATGVSSVTF